MKEYVLQGRRRGRYRDLESFGRESACGKSVDWPSILKARWEAHRDEWARLGIDHARIVSRELVEKVETP